MAENGEDDDIFVYTGGEQVVPDDVRRVRIDKSVNIIPRLAFDNRRRLIDVEFHDGIEIIEVMAFNNCISLRGSIQLLGVKIIGKSAFSDCRAVTDVAFGDTLETIGSHAFCYCTSLRRTITMPSVKTVGRWAFKNCEQLTDLEFGEELETIQERAFDSCLSLRRIAMPLMSNMIGADVFYFCPNLTTVDLVGGIHNTIASLHLEGWKNEMKDEINRINQALPDLYTEEKTPVVRDWMRTIIRRIDHYKTEHRSLLKESTTLLELALWKAKIEENEEDSLGDVKAEKAKIDIQSKRSERRIISGANIVIKNVLPFLELK
eukprot:scaffold33569_cov84-Skeletonema_dohrnii-CCMP3373.AAC.11